ncbi:MAG: polyprenyl synthetase family protein [Acidobacteriota bacterium]|nr:polyprenyl synthetase family protein [Acidobacteriota bacterium]
MKVEDRLAEKKQMVERELERILSRGQSVLCQAMRYSVFSGGKRFRPLLALSSGESFRVRKEVVLPFACAVELIHSYSLIHDDLPSMDDDDFRRGKPSCHKAYGENVALLAGDGLLTLAFEVMARAPLDKKDLWKKEQVIKTISTLVGIEGMIGGQILDITSPLDKISEEKVYELILKKTGSLIMASVKIGAILGNATAIQQEAIMEYGKYIGFAFQIRDDILDSTKDMSKGRLARPNFVLHFGIDEAKQRLSYFVEAGIKALDEARIVSEEMCFMGQKLLEIEEKN